MAVSNICPSSWWAAFVTDDRCAGARAGTGDGARAGVATRAGDGAAWAAGVGAATQAGAGSAGLWYWNRFCCALGGA